MADLDENTAFLIKIGQIKEAPKAEPKPAAKKDEE